MKISELIERLEELKEKHGDLEVGVWDNEWDRDTLVLEVYHTNEGDFVNFNQPPKKGWISIQGH